MATLKPAVVDPPARPLRTSSYVPRPPPPTPMTSQSQSGLAGPIAIPLDFSSLTLSNNATTSLPNIPETTSISRNDQITTHVLNQSTGKPAAGLRASLTLVNELSSHNKRPDVTFTGMTDGNGRILDWYTDDAPMSVILDEHTKDRRNPKRVWMLKLESEDYWQILGKETFIPQVEIKFYIHAAAEGGTRGHWHVPVLLGQWGYTAYRGN